MTDAHEDDQLLLDRLTHFGMEAQASVTGYRPGPNDQTGQDETETALVPEATARPDCDHRTSVLVQTLVAFIAASDDEPERWEVRVRAMCECGRGFAVETRGRPPRDGRPGAVLAMHPLADPGT